MAFCTFLHKIHIFENIAIEIEFVDGKYRWRCKNLEKGGERTSYLFNSAEDCMINAVVEGWRQKIARESFPSAIIDPDTDIIIEANAVAKELFKMPSGVVLKDSSFWSDLQQREDYRRSLEVYGTSQRKVTLLDSTGSEFEVLADDRIVIVAEQKPLIIAKAIV